jgi:hypothetical protein
VLKPASGEFNSVSEIFESSTDILFDKVAEVYWWIVSTVLHLIDSADYYY